MTFGYLERRQLTEIAAEIGDVQIALPGVTSAQEALEIAMQIRALTEKVERICRGAACVKAAGETC